MTSKEFISTAGGKLAATATAAWAFFGTILVEPMALYPLIEFLPEPVRLGLYLIIALAIWFFPKKAQAKDAEDGSE